MEKNDGFNRRLFLVAASTTFLEACASFRESFNVKLLGAVEKTYDHPDPLAARHFLCEQFILNHHNFPTKGSLSERVSHGLADGVSFLEFLHKNQETVFREEVPSARDLCIIKSAPYPQGSTQRDFAERYLIMLWLNMSAHLVQGGVAAAPQIFDECLKYIHARRENSFHDESESHIMAQEAEFAEYAPDDPRLKDIIKTRYEKGITIKSGGNHFNNKGAKISLVDHSPQSDDDPLPPTEELSWAMLVPAHLNIPYKEAFMRLIKPEGKEFPITPQRLASVALHYCNFLSGTFQAYIDDIGVAKIPEDDGVENIFTEYGVHAVHGALVILGKYAKEIEEDDPDLFKKLSAGIPRTINLIIRIIEMYDKDPYWYGGHLVQAIFDENAAPVFSTIDNDKLMTAAEVVKTRPAFLDYSNLNEQDEAITEDFENIRWICNAATSDPREIVSKNKDDVSWIPFMVGHTVAGLKKLHALLSDKTF